MAKMSKKFKTDIFKICNLIYENSWTQNGIDYTTEKSHWRWSDLWALLINIGCHFSDKSIKAITDWSNEDRYNPQISSPDEEHYHLAAQMGHVSFCRAYEHLRGRKPFIAKSVNYGYGRYRAYNCHNGSRTQGRLAMGCKLPWQGEQVTVTSFNDTDGYLIACAYHPPKSEDDYGNRIKKRFKITNDDLIQARKDSK